MKKLLLAVILLLGGAGASHAQGRDTVFAVRKLFRQHYRGGLGMAATGLAVGAGGTNPQGRPASRNDNVAGSLLAGAVPTALGLRKAARFSPEREAAVLKQYAEGWGLPRDIRRRLRRKHFHRTAQDVLAQQP